MLKRYVMPEGTQDYFLRSGDLRQRAGPRKEFLP